MLVYCVYLISLVSLIGYYSTFNICITENYQLLWFRLKEILKVMSKLIRIDIHCTFKLHAVTCCHHAVNSSLHLSLLCPAGLGWRPGGRAVQHQDLVLHRGQH